MMKALLFYWDPGNWPLAREALHKAGAQRSDRARAALPRAARARRSAARAAAVQEVARVGANVTLGNPRRGVTAPAPFLRSDAIASLTDALAHFEEHGFARLGPVMTDEGLAMLRERADAIMLGKVSHAGMFFQLDTDTGSYRDLVFGRGYEGPSLNYRKIEKLEKDDLFWSWIENPLFERASRALISGPIVIYRAVLMTKGSQGGTVLPWHQDGGLFWGLDRDPILQIWTALDDAPVDAGCVEVLPGSHKQGLATPLGGVVPDEHVLRHRRRRETLAASGRGGRSHPPSQPSLASIAREPNGQDAPGFFDLLHERRHQVHAQEARAARVRSGLFLNGTPAKRPSS